MIPAREKGRDPALSSGLRGPAWSQDASISRNGVSPSRAAETLRERGWRHQGQAKEAQTFIRKPTFFKGCFAGPSWMQAVHLSPKFLSQPNPRATTLHAMDTTEALVPLGVPGGPWCHLCPWYPWLKWILVGPHTTPLEAQPHMQPPPPAAHP